jgi:hypothetical protein
MDSVHVRPVATISENYPTLGACYAGLLPRQRKVLHAVSPARRPVRAAIFRRSRLWSAGEGSFEKMMLKQEAKANWRCKITSL